MGYGREESKKRTSPSTKTVASGQPGRRDHGGRGLEATAIYFADDVGSY